MSLGFKAQEIALRELFLEADSFHMPPYQRGYSWTEKEALELVEDLYEASQRGRSYFLGAIVIIQNSSKDSVEVIDGQQRLATLTMIFAILRDLSPFKDEASRIHDLLESRKILSSRQWRLTLNNVDTPIFREVVQKKDAKQNVEKYISAGETSLHILNNVQALREYLSNLKDQERSDLVNLMMRKCGVVKVKVEDRDYGYSTFRVLNTRGNEPSSNDILKSELFELAGFNDDEAAVHAIAWNKFGRRLHSTSFDDLLKLIWIIHGKPADDVLSGFRSNIIPELTARGFLEDILPRYVDAFELLLGLRSPGDGFPEAAKNYILFMRYLDHSGWQIPVLKYLIAGDLSAEGLTRFLKAMERLAYCMQFVKTDSNFRARRYNRIVKAIEDGADLYAEDSALLLKVDEAKDLSERLEGRFATYGQRRALTFRLNAEVEGGKPISTDSDATLEHILPRNPGPKSSWKDDWPSTNKQREYVDCIGNFTLLNNSENQEADRKDFVEKKAIFFKSEKPSFAITRDIIEYDRWTATEVAARRKKLADLLRKAWELN